MSRVTCLEPYSRPLIAVTNHSENCLMVASMFFSRLMNSSSSFISSRGESMVKRFRIGTPILDRRSNLRRISYFSFISASSDILRGATVGAYGSALKFIVPPIWIGPVSSDDGTSLGPGAGAGTSSNVIVGRSTVSRLAMPAACGFMRRSTSILTSCLGLPS